MTPKTTSLPLPDAWDASTCDALIAELWSLREALVAMEHRLAPWLREAAPAQVASAVNLTHFLALRHIDLRRLQERLAWVGVSSLGRAESHVMANVDKVLGILHRLAGRPWAALSQSEPGIHRGRALLELHTEALFGATPEGRTVRIMVTLPSEAAHDEALVEGLVGAGMDIARVNCAHDGPAEWLAMVQRVRNQAQRAGRHVRVLMDLGGPKLRTGPLPDGPAVVKLRPVRDAHGRVTAPAFLGLRPAGSALSVHDVDLTLDADAAFLTGLDAGATVELTDTRSARRLLRVVERQGEAVRLSCDRTVYLGTETRLRLRRAGKAAHDKGDNSVDDKTHAARHETPLAGLPAPRGQLLLQRGDRLDLVPEGPGHAAMPATKSKPARPARIACTLPQALASVRKGERIWFDDGRIGGMVRRRRGKHVEVEITQARDGGERLAADKGINLPDTRLDLPALTDKDLEDLEIVARHADLVGLSFAQSAADVRMLHAKLVALGAPQVGVVLKIETQRGFEHLPEMLLAAMACPAAGVMIARGDLAVECGYERMAEVQEQILWACEAAHMPVVWATQVLETLAKTGLPSRAEITDAAMGERAECVMLNKGPHILDAMRMLDDILRRMQAHQSKKRPLLRALKAWTASLEAAEKSAARTTAAAPKKAAAAPAATAPTGVRTKRA